MTRLEEFQGEMEICYLAVIDVTAEAAQTRHVFEVCENFCRFGDNVTLFVAMVDGRPSQILNTRVIKVRTFGEECLQSQVNLDLL